MEKIILIGSGGHSKSVIDTIERSGAFEIAGYIDASDAEKSSYRVYHHIGSDSDLRSIYNSGIKYAFICIGYLGKGNVRDKIYGELKTIGYILPNIIDDTALVARDVIMGDGIFIGKNAVVNANAKLGRMSIINTATIVEHDCSIGEYTHIAVSAVICGGTSIGSHCLVGANATIIQALSICNNVIIGAGTTVSKSITNPCTVIGKKMEILEQGDAKKCQE